MLISPTEPALLRAAGTTSQFPEVYGADVLIATTGGWVGVQRKEVGDLLSSVEDGRLAVQVSQMQRLRLAVLAIEGRVQWTTSGEMLGSGFGRPWTRDQWRRFLWSIRKRGVWVDWTDSVADTLALCRALEGWVRKDKHAALARRPGPTAVWGRPDHRDFAVHLLMGLPGVGPELAARVVDRFGGVPWRWDVEEGDLTGVEGIGKKKAATMYRALKGKSE